jgi:transcriptional regulator with XRE-family HTH domain
MADLCIGGDRLPLAFAGFKQLANGGVERFVHRATLVKHSSGVKEQFTRWLGHARPMSEKTISQVVAENLAYRMGKLSMTQGALAAKAGLSQKTISNYLNPEQRTEGSKGKQGSPKLWELERVARALGAEVWELTRAMNERERAMYDAIEKAYKELLESTAASSRP